MIRRTRFLTFGFLLFLAEAKGMPLRFDLSGSDQCHFHVVNGDDSQSQATVDVVEEVLGLNQGPQLWTVTAWSWTQIGNRSVRDSSYYTESCSVTFIIQVSPTFRPRARSAVQRRLKDPDQQILFIFDLRRQAQVLNPKFVFDLEFDELTYTHVHLLRLRPNKLEVEAGSTVSIRKMRNQFVAFPFLTTSLAQMKDFAIRVRDAVLEPFLEVGAGPPIQSSESVARACQFLYSNSNRDSAARRIIGCNPEWIFLENAAGLANLTVDYCGQLSAYIMRARVGAGWQDPSAYQYRIDQFYERTERGKFLYCTRSQEREVFSFFFWAMPFDSESWLLFGLTALLLILLLKGQWLEVLAAVSVRQYMPSLRGPRLTILCMSASMVLNYSYEGVISSHVIVPPALSVFSNLRELLDRNYEIGTFVSRVPVGPNDPQELERIYKREKIQSRLQVKRYYMEDWKTRADIYALCNVTFMHTPLALPHVKLEVEERHAGVKCHAVRETVYIDDYVSLLFGHGTGRLSAGAEYLRGSGILPYIYEHANYVTHYDQDRKVKLVEEKEKTDLKGFLVTNPKVFSIFCLWAGILTMALVAFVFETVAKK